MANPRTRTTTSRPQGASAAATNSRTQRTRIIGSKSRIAPATVTAPADLGGIMLSSSSTATTTSTTTSTSNALYSQVSPEDSNDGNNDLGNVMITSEDDDNNNDNENNNNNASSSERLLEQQQHDNCSVTVDNGKGSNISSLCVAFLASLTTGGTTYAFGIYGAALKHELHLSQAQLDTISTANFCAGMFSWIPGLVVDKFGTRFSLAAGGIIGALSLIAYWAVARQFWYINNTTTIVATLSVLGILIFLSAALVTGSVFKIIVGTCGPGTKGSAVGVAKGYVGLGAGAYACLFETIRTKSESDLDFLPMAAFFCLFVVTMPALCLLPNHQQLKSQNLQDESTPLHFRTLFCSLLVMAIFIITSSMLQLMDDDASSTTTTSTEAINQQSTTATVRQEYDGHRILSDNDIFDFDAVENTTVTHDNVTELGAYYNDYSNMEEQYTVGQIVKALSLIAIWLGPIFSLLLLPRRKYAPLVDRDDNDNQDDSNVDSNEEDDSDDSHEHFTIDDEPMNNSNEEGNKSSPTEGEVNALLSSSSLEQDSSGTGQIGTSDELHTANDNENDNNNNNNNNNTQAAAGGNYNLAEMLQTPSAMLMLWTTTILAGAGTVETNNMGQMVESLGLPADAASASLALFSVAQAGARVVTGAVSESALNWRTRNRSTGCCCSNKSAMFIQGGRGGIPRPFFLVCASIASFLAHGLLALAQDKYTFVIGATCAGAAFGMIWPLMVLIVGEVFGTANVGANYMFFDGFTSAVGTLILSKMVAQQVYEDHIVIDFHNDTASSAGAAAITIAGAEGPAAMDVAADGDDDDNLTCLGMGCFQITHLTVAGLALTCALTSWRMLYTTKDVYNKPNQHDV